MLVIGMVACEIMSLSIPPRAGSVKLFEVGQKPGESRQTQKRGPDSEESGALTRIAGYGRGRDTTEGKEKRYDEAGLGSRS